MSTDKLYKQKHTLTKKLYKHKTILNQQIIQP